jgi:hypothetical protein
MQDVPIPIIHQQCKHRCCQRSYLPLELSFARTLHRFQGLQAGPVDSGKPPNAFRVLVCDPDTKAAEGRATGFLYTMLSRATTFGDQTGLNSAIYFIGPNLTKERIMKLTLKTNSNQLIKNIERRNRWVAHLEHHVVHRQANYSKIHKWLKNRYTYDELYDRTNSYIKSKLR